MADTTQCPNCKRRLEIPESHLGKSVQCPQCRNTFIAADPGAASTGPSEPARLPTPKPDPEPPPPPARRSGFDWSRNDDPYNRPARRVDRRYDDDRSRYSVPHRGGLVVTLGVLSIFICFFGFILGVSAWVMGANDLSEIRAGRMDRSGEGVTQAGMICGIFGTVIWALGTLIFLIANSH